MSNPLSDVLPLLAFWRANWQSLILGLVLFMGALAVFFSGLVYLVLFTMEYRKHRTGWAARRNTQQFFRENVMAPSIAYLLLIPIFGAVYWPYAIDSKNASAAKTLQTALKTTESERDAARRSVTELNATLE
jgi:predicted negative regulator of RcsB-dependent stress response